MQTSSKPLFACKALVGSHTVKIDQRASTSFFHLRTKHRPFLHPQYTTPPNITELFFPSQTNKPHPPKYINIEAKNKTQRRSHQEPPSLKPFFPPLHRGTPGTEIPLHPPLHQKKTPLFPFTKAPKPSAAAPPSLSPNDQPHSPHAPSPTPPPSPPSTAAPPPRA